MGIYEVPLSISLLGFGMGTMLANFHMCGILLLFRAVFMRAYVFSLSGPCELLFLLCFIASCT